MPYKSNIDSFCGLWFSSQSTANSIKAELLSVLLSVTLPDTSVRSHSQMSEQVKPRDKIHNSLHIYSQIPGHYVILVILRQMRCIREQAPCEDSRAAYSSKYTGEEPFLTAEFIPHFNRTNTFRPWISFRLPRHGRKSYPVTHCVALWREAGVSPLH